MNVFPEVGGEILDDRFAILISSAEHSESGDLPLLFSSRLVQKHLEAVSRSSSVAKPSPWLERVETDLLKSGPL